MVKVPGPYVHRSKKIRMLALKLNCCSKIKNKKSSSSYFILQLIQVKVHGSNTLLVQEKVRSLGILLLFDTLKSVCVCVGGGVFSSRINNCPASLRHGLDQVVNHLRWDGHPLLLECLRQLTHICMRARSNWNTSLQVAPSVFVWV